MTSGGRQPFDRRIKDDQGVRDAQTTDHEAGSGGNRGTGRARARRPTRLRTREARRAGPARRADGPRADRRRHADRRRQSRQPALLGADADHQAATSSKLAPAWRTHVSAVAPATDDVGQQTTPIVVDGVIYVDTPERRRHRRRRRDRRAHVEVGATASTDCRARAAASRRATARSSRSPAATASSRSTRPPARRSGRCSRQGPNGEDLGRVGKVATVYYDGIVYAHAADGDRGAVVALDASDGAYLWHFFGGPKRGEHVHRRRRHDLRRVGDLGAGAARRHRLRRRGRCDARGCTAPSTPSSACTT